MPFRVADFMQHIFHVPNWASPSLAQDCDTLQGIMRYLNTRDDWTFLEGGAGLELCGAKGK